MSPIDQKQSDEEQETVERQKAAKDQKTTGDQTLTLLAFLLGMLVGTIIGLVLTGEPTTDAPPPKKNKNRKGK